MKFAAPDCHIRRQARRIGPGLLGVNQVTTVSAAQSAVDVTARYWMYAVVHVERGRVSYLRDDRLVTVPVSRYALYAPRFSIVEVLLEHTRAGSQALASAQVPANDLPREPVVLCDPPERPPSSVAEIEALVRSHPDVIRVGRFSAPRPSAIRIKQAIDASYTRSQPLADVAQRLRIAPSTMSRCFRRTYGMTPVRYRHRLRIVDGMLRLLEGAAVAEVCQDVGFGDLSRFYRHFRSLTLSSPATYRL